MGKGVLSNTLLNFLSNSRLARDKPCGRRRRRKATRERRPGLAITLLILTVILGTGCHSGSSSNPPISGQQAPQIPNSIDAILLNYLTTNNIPGATVAVTKNGRLVLWKGYGMADREANVPMRPWHRTPVGSVSKVLTAIGALQLVEQGAMQLDQPLYSSQISPIFGRDGTIWFISNPDGILSDTGMYFEALAEAPANLANVNPTNHTPAYLLGASEQENINTIMEWASKIQLQHALTHTAGFIGSGKVEIARSYWGLSDSDPLTYGQLHAAMLAGVAGLPLRFEAGTDVEYSNHGFGVVGLAIADRSGMEYVDYMQQNVFLPLGLDVVPVNVVESIDAATYDMDGNGNVVRNDRPQGGGVPLGLATGGWAASAYDLARVMCALDAGSNTTRLLDQATVKEMLTPRFKNLSSGIVLGWDTLVWLNYATKTGLYRGKDGGRGGARISKYLPEGPGSNTSLVDSEINVAVAFNVDVIPPDSLLRGIAERVNKAEIPEDFDLFDPDYPCVETPGTTLTLG